MGQVDNKVLGERRLELALEPVTGKALPVYAGEVLRITQEVGSQCVDFNCFNLHDYKECMSVGMMRRSGFRAHQGDYVLSAPPRSRPLMQILTLPPTCVTDLLALRCSADYFEATWGFALHTNCQDTLAEAIREYGLTPDDTHDSFNMWMNTGWDDQGQWVIRENTGLKGDHVDLLAMTDVLAVPIVCGSGDVGGTSGFFLKPIRVEVYRSSESTEEMVREGTERVGRYRNQRRLQDYDITEIRVDRELVADADYEPNYIGIDFVEIAVQVTPAVRSVLDRLISLGYFQDAEDAIRSGAFGWYLQNRSEPSPFGPRPSLSS